MTPSAWPDRLGAVEAGGPDAPVAAHYGDPVAEQKALTAGAVVDLSHLGIVKLTGSDRLLLLHNLSTAHVVDAAPGTSTEMLILSPLGRVEYGASVIETGDATWLITESAAAAPMAEWLASMRFMFDVRIDDVTDTYAAIGSTLIDLPVALATHVITQWIDPWPHVGDGGTSYAPAETAHRGEGWRWSLLVIKRANLEEFARACDAVGVAVAGVWASEALRIDAGRPRVGREVDPRTLPAELDWLRTAVHLEKGCYRGQESVARIHNLGRAPRRLVFLHLDGSAHLIPTPGAEVSLGGRVIGTVTSVARHHELGPIALAVIKRNVAVDAVLGVAVDQLAEPITAAQEILVNPEGIAVTRPRVNTKNLTNGAIRAQKPSERSKENE